jgi:transketolase N-terminal domain/subunit
VAYEALAVAAHTRPDSFVVVIDFNGWQTDGPTAKVHGGEPRRLLGGLGLNIVDVDGHDAHAVLEAVRSGLAASPSCIMARTKRCSGLEWASSGAELYGETLSDKLRAALLNWACS